MHASAHSTNAAQDSWPSLLGTCLISALLGNIRKAKMGNLSDLHLSSLIFVLLIISIVIILPSE